MKNVVTVQQNEKNLPNTNIKNVMFFWRTTFEQGNEILNAK